MAHLDTVQTARHFCVCDFEDDETLVYNSMLDDRLGVYTILDLLPKLDVITDVLFTENEEMGMSTAADFKTYKEYNWMVEFDRRGTGCVTYQYNWDNGVLQEYFPSVGRGTFSDIWDLDHLCCKGINVGVGYENEHSKRAYFVVENYLEQIARFVAFWQTYKDQYFEHKYVPGTYKGRYATTGYYSGDDWSHWNEYGEYWCPGCHVDKDKDEVVYDTTHTPICRTCGDECYALDTTGTEPRCG